MITNIAHMDNEILFKALSSKTRVNILHELLNQELHVSALAKAVGISKPVASRHIKILEQGGLLTRRVVGNVHLLSVNLSTIERAFSSFSKKTQVAIDTDSSLFDAIKQLPDIEIHKTGDNQYITSIDGEKGYYIYEVDGVSPTIPIDKYKPTENVNLTLKKLISINKKTIEVSVKKDQK